MSVTVRGLIQQDCGALCQLTVRPKEDVSADSRESLQMWEWGRGHSAECVFSGWVGSMVSSHSGMGGEQLLPQPR